jgi:hypothetical protein
MSNTFQRYVQKHAASQERKLGSPTFEYGGQSYPCIENIEERGVVINDQGNEVAYTGKLRARADLFSEEDSPSKGDEITINDEVRKVAKVQSILGLLWIFLTDETT